MLGKRSDAGEPTREATRYDSEIPIVIELKNGLFRQADRMDAYLVDLSATGAALVTKSDARYRVKDRYRVAVDDHAGIIEIRNLTESEDTGQVRLGVKFSRLGLELQELMVDSLADAKAKTNRLT